MTRCLGAACGATVKEPSSALGWERLELIGGTGSAWFCDRCVAARKRPNTTEGANA